MSKSIEGGVTRQNVIEAANKLCLYIRNVQLLSQKEKDVFLQKAALIPLMCSCVDYNTQDDEYNASEQSSEDSYSYSDALKELQDISEVLKLKVSVNQCIEALEKSGAKSKDNILHEKYLVVKRIKDSLDKIEKEDIPTYNKATLSALSANDYGIQKNREAYRHAFNQNRQPTGREILETHRHPIIDRLLLVLKEIFLSKKEKAASSYSENPNSIWKKPLPLTRTEKLLNIAPPPRSS